MACPNKWITDVLIYNNQVHWVQPTSYTHNTPFGDRYTWDCTQQPSIQNCEYSLPISIYLLTYTDEPMTLSNVITNLYPNAIFETTCELCTAAAQTCSTITTTTTTTKTPSVSPTITVSSNNIIIQNHNHTQERWVAFYLKDIDLSCGAEVVDVEISDNFAYKNKWVSYDPVQFTSWGHYSFLWNNVENNASYTLPLSVRITGKYNGRNETIYGTDVITNWDGLFTFNFGSNFCQNNSTDNPITIPTITPTSMAVSPSSLQTTTESNGVDTREDKGVFISVDVLLIVAIAIASVFCGSCICLFCFLLRGKTSKTNKGKRIRTVSMNSKSSEHMYEKPKNIELVPDVKNLGSQEGEKNVTIEHSDLKDQSSSDSELMYLNVPNTAYI